MAIHRKTALHSYAWLYTAKHGNGNTGVYIVIHGNTLLNRAINGYTQLYMAMHDNTGIHGNRTIH